MRSLTIGILFLSSICLQAQTYASLNQTSSLGGVSTVDAKVNGNNGVAGTTYLFKDWNNKAKIYADNGKVLNVENINFNANNALFSSKISKDSVFNFYSIYKVEVNGKRFETIDNKFYEVLYTFNDGQIFLKEYSVIVKPELAFKSNTVVGPGKYVIEDALYVYKDEAMEKFWPSKRNVLKIVNSQKSAITKQVKKNNLSYSKADDIAEIFKYYDTLN